ncbi:MAG: DM13 domain-containing protein [Gammaproteobacteria bacterium]|nr:DM13 domain-containing protein [Gammaproteobacteria bacterium]
MKTFRNLLIGFVIGVVVGGGAMLIAFPFLFPPPVVNESVSQIEGVVERQSIYTGAFREDAPGQDFAHWAKGRISVHDAAGDEAWIQLESDFEASTGPNYWVYLNSQSAIDDESDFLADEQRVRLAKLKSFSGSQIYTTSKLDLMNKQAVTIWCESFDQYIGSADFEEPAPESIDASG